MIKPTHLIWLSQRYDSGTYWSQIKLSTCWALACETLIPSVFPNTWAFQPPIVESFFLHSQFPVVQEFFGEMIVSVETIKVTVKSYPFKIHVIHLSTGCLRVISDPMESLKADKVSIFIRFYRWIFSKRIPGLIQSNPFSITHDSLRHLLLNTSDIMRGILWNGKQTSCRLFCDKEDLAGIYFSVNIKTVSSSVQLIIFENIFFSKPFDVVPVFIRHSVDQIN